MLDGLMAKFIRIAAFTFYKKLFLSLAVLMYMLYLAHREKRFLQHAPAF